MTPNIVPSIFPWHRLCKTVHKTYSFLFFYLSLCQAIGFPMHAFFAFHLKSKIIMRNVRNRGFKYCENTEQSSVLVCLFRDVRDFIEVWIVNENRVTVHRSDLVELLGLITCVEGGLGQTAKLLAARARTGKYGKNVDRNVMSKWVCRNSKDGWDMRREKARWRAMTHMQQTPFSWPWALRVCDTHEKCADVRRQTVQQKNVRATSESMYTPVVHTVVATTCVRNPSKLCKENSVKKT